MNDRFEDSFYTKAAKFELQDSEFGVSQGAFAARPVDLFGKVTSLDFPLPPSNTFDIFGGLKSFSVSRTIGKDSFKGRTFQMAVKQNPQELGGETFIYGMVIFSDTSTPSKERHVYTLPIVNYLLTHPDFKSYSLKDVLNRFSILGVGITEGHHSSVPITLMQTNSPFYSSITNITYCFDGRTPTKVHWWDKLSEEDYLCLKLEQVNVGSNIYSFPDKSCKKSQNNGLSWQFIPCVYRDRSKIAVFNHEEENLGNKVVLPVVLNLSNMDLRGKKQLYSDTTGIYTGPVLDCFVINPVERASIIHGL